MSISVKSTLIGHTKLNDMGLAFSDLDDGCIYQCPFSSGKNFHGKQANYSVAADRIATILHTLSL
ncbi:MAG: hypothetical protein ACTS7E_05015 [Arsenophonus sp. NC-CH8-MAG3]